VAEVQSIFDILRGKKRPSVAEGIPPPPGGILTSPENTPLALSAGSDFIRQQYGPNVTATSDQFPAKGEDYTPYTDRSFGRALRGVSSGVNSDAFEAALNNPQGYPLSKNVVDRRNESPMNLGTFLQYLNAKDSKPQLAIDEDQLPKGILSQVIRTLLGRK
jgi:hypothetical protein